MSRDGQRVAFATWIDGRNVVVEDGRPGEPFDSVAWPLALSDDGRVVAYAARLGVEQFCVAAGRRSAPYTSVAFPVVSPDGRHVAFAASDGVRWFVVSDGRRGESFEWVGHLALGSGRLAYAAQQGRDSFVVFDGQRGPPFDRVTRPVISGDGRRVGYGARLNGQWFLVTGDRKQGVDHEIGSVFLSYDGNRAGYVVETPGQCRVVGSSRMGPRFDWVGWPAFTNEGRVVYLAGRGPMKFLVADDEAIELGEGVVWDLTLSPDGSRAGFGARIGRKLYWKNMALPASGSAGSAEGKGEEP